MLTAARPLLLLASTVAAGVHAHRIETRGRIRALRVTTTSGGRAWTAPLAIRIDAALRDAGVSLTAGDAVRLWIAGAGALVVIGLAITPAFAMLALAVSTAAAPMGIALARARHARRRTAALPALLDQIAHELRGGGTIAGGLATAARGGGPLAADCQRIVNDTVVGRSLADALATWTQRSPGDGVRAIAGALVLAAATGGQAAAALDGLAAGLRDEAVVAAEARALSTQARLSAAVVALTPLGYLALSAIAGGPEVGFLLHTGLGRMCGAAGLALDGLAAVWMRRIVRARP